MTNLEKNETWVYVNLKDIERGRNLMRAKFVFDIKRGAKVEFLKFKARMVACGDTQVEGVDLFETLAYKEFQDYANHLQ